MSLADVAIDKASRGGTVTIESVRLAHPVVGLRANFAISSSACGSGLATEAILAHGRGSYTPRGVSR